MRFLSKAKIKGETALVRVDLNTKKQKVNFRLEAVLPTIKFLLERDIKVVLLSHWGRPGGPNKDFSLEPFSKILSHYLGGKVIFFPKFNFSKIKKEINKSKPGSIFLLENLRFLPGEEKNSKKLGKELSLLGNFYVNDAFAVSHRKNASVSAITDFLPSFVGFLLEKEIKNLNKVMKNPRGPISLIIGGAKISDKLGVVDNFFPSSRRKVVCFLLGGGPANTFFAARSLPIGDSLVDKDQITILKKKEYFRSDNITLPIDVRVRQRQILDIGPKTAEEYSKVINSSRTIIWSGPVGNFEKNGFEEGTKSIWKAILSNKKAHIVVGGGETISSLNLVSNGYKIASQNKNLFLSTGGGAMLTYLSGKKLPGIEALI